MQVWPSQLEQVPREDVDLMLAYLEMKAETNSNGQNIYEATANEADPMEYGPYRYVAHMHTDWSEKERLDAIDALRKQLGPEANLNGVYFSVEKVTNN